MVSVGYWRRLAEVVLLSRWFNDAVLMFAVSAGENGIKAGQ